ncbi:MAG: serine/threonine-protein phosphatase [Ignavibacteriales bacterium]|nr:serine/threonine-protein phosphatase [Ignavibacteriales bacterium]
MVTTTLRSLRDFYDVFRTGLTSAEIEKLLSDDARGMYSFYVRNMPPRNPAQSRFIRFLKFSWHLFLAFLLKLTPARRLFYAIALLLVGLAFWDSDLMKAFYGFLILNFLLALELADKLVTRDELEFARQIQLSLLPDSLIPVEGFAIASHSDVAESVGGDYYDLIPMNDGSTMVVVGDVSGKGISAALYMVKVQTALQLLAKEVTDPRELMIRLNEYLYKKLRRNFFLTITILKVYHDGKILCCRAGHMPALLLDARLRTCSWIQPRGTAIGLAPPAVADKSKGNGETHTMFEQSLEIEQLSMEKGDTLILYTDGVIESVNRHREEFGEGRLMQVVLDSAGEDVDEVKERLIKSIASFRNGEELRDDTTFVILKRNGTMT